MSAPRHARSHKGTVKSKTRGSAFALVLMMLVAIGFGNLASASPAFAHTPTVTATCSVLNVNLVNYQVKQGTPEIPGALITEEVPAWDEVVVDTPAGWQRYSWNGDWDLDSAPPFPDARWQANVAGDPHGVGVAGAYFRSHGNSGGGDWFYLEAVPEVSHTVHHDAIPAVYGPSTPAVPPSMNHVVVTIDGVVQDDVDFGASFVRSYAFNSQSVAHTYSVVVTAWDDPTGSKGWTKTFTGTTTPCYDNSLRPSLSADSQCGSWTGTFNNPTKYGWVFDYQVDGEAASGPGWGTGPVYRTVYIAAFGGTQTRTVTFPEDSGEHTVMYRLNVGPEQDWYIPAVTVTIETNCAPDPVTVNFDLQSGPPSCAADGTLPELPAETDGYSLAWDRPFDGPGDYTLNATADEGKVIEGPVSKVFTVLPQLDVPGPGCPVVVELKPLEVEQMYCTAAEDGLSQSFTPSEITAPAVEGMSYSIEGGEWTNLAPDTYTVTGTPDQYRFIDAESLPEGWTLNEDGTASIEVTIEQPDSCLEPFTEKKSTSATATDCALTTVVTQQWERYWTIVDNKLTPGEWVKVGTPTSVSHKATAAEIAAVPGLVCSKPPTVGPKVETGYVTDAGSSSPWAGLALALGGMLLAGFGLVRSPFLSKARQR